MKKLTALLLTLVLALVLTAPAAFAQEEENQSTINWDDFYIITQPQARKSIYAGESYTLSVEVHIPEGVEVEYRWWSFGHGGVLSGNTEAVLQISPDDSWVRREENEFACDIIGYEKDGDTVISSKTLLSEYAVVYLRGTALENLYDLFTQPLFMGTVTSVSGILPTLLGAPIALIVFPLLAPVMGIWTFFNIISEMIMVARVY